MLSHMIAATATYDTIIDPSALLDEGAKRAGDGPPPERLVKCS